MHGFSNKYKSFPEYIIGITKEIWEERGISTLHEYYAPDIIVRSPGSIVIGNEKVSLRPWRPWPNFQIVLFTVRM